MTNMEKFRVLYVNGGLLDQGGITTYMINFASHLKDYGIIVDYVVHGFEEGPKDKFAIDMGSKIYRVPVKSKKPLKNILEIKKILENGKYPIVHSHMDAGNAVVLYLAKKCDVSVRISHSHNTDFLTDNKLKLLVNRFFKSVIKKNATHYFACSKDASKWLYGNEDAIIINNAIALEKFYFNFNMREKIRDYFQLDGKFVIGHVGRFDHQKNHFFILEVFAKLLSKCPSAVLMLVGDGILKENVISKSKELGVYEKIIFTGSVENVNDYYNAMDLFIFPSKFEGLGISLIEAQINGLKCVISENIPNEAKLSSYVETVDIGCGPEYWSKVLEKYKHCNRYTLHYDLIKQFDIEYESKRLAEMYKFFLNKE